MKKAVHMCMAAVLGMGLVCGAAWGQSKVEKPIVLRMADYYPPTHSISRDFKKYFMEPVEQRSQGRIKFDYYGNQTLIKALDICQGVMEGIADMGNTSQQITVMFPVSSFSGLPGAALDNDIVKYTKASWPVYRKHIGRLTEKNGMQFIAGPYLTNYQIAGRNEPRRTAALNGMKIRTTGSVLPHSLRNLGGVSVGMAIPDAYEAMSKNVLDGISLPIPSYKSYQFHELMTWALTNVNLGSGIVAYGMNIKKFNSLPADLQKILVDVGNEASLGMAKSYCDEVLEDIAAWKSKGIAIIIWSPAEKQKADFLLKEVWSVWIKEQEKRYPETRQIMSEWADSLAKEGIPLSQHYTDAIAGK